MTELHLPFLEAAVAVPLVGAAFLARVRDVERAHRWATLIAALALLCSVGAWQDFNILHSGQLHASVAHDHWDALSSLFGGRLVLVVDELTAPLLPTVSLLYFLTILATQRTKRARFSFSLSLASEAITLAAFSCREPWLVVALLALGILPTFLEVRGRGRSTRVFAIHMMLFVALLALGWALVEFHGRDQVASAWTLLPLIAAIFIRSGMMPLHLWVSDLFENAGLGTALLFIAPNLGAYAAIRLLIPVASDEVLRSLAMIGIMTAVYAAGMSVVQREARRFYCYLLLSHSAFVLVGLVILTPIALTGGLCAWLSVAIALGGLGLALRAVEARFDRLSLIRFHGLYEHTPALAVCFAITGLASVGFPGTIGFVGNEMLLDSVVTAYPYLGIGLLIAMALNSISIIRAYFTLFTGARLATSVSLIVGTRERVAVIVIAALLLGGGIYPQLGVASRNEAAIRILEDRVARANRAARPVRAIVENVRTSPR